MKKLADYKTKKERIACLLHVECLASDELWKLPLKEGVELVKEISSLAKRYLDGEEECDPDFEVKGCDGNCSCQSTGGQMFDLMKTSPAINKEDCFQYLDRLDVSIGDKLNTPIGSAEVCKTVDGCCSYCIFDNMEICPDCAGIYFKKIEE